MRHSGNYATMIAQKYFLNGIEIKLYIYDELDRFVTVGSILLSDADLTHMQRGIELRRQEESEKEQPTLPPWS